MVALTLDILLEENFSYRLNVRGIVESTLDPLLDGFNANMESDH